MVRPRFAARTAQPALDGVAEGIEDAETAGRMVAYGFELLQGYHLARPMTENGLLDYLAADSRTARTPD